jgi:hypothetical protein
MECVVCEETKDLSVCEECDTLYCGEDCQRIDWKRKHQFECGEKVGLTIKTFAKLMENHVRCDLEKKTEDLKGWYKQLEGVDQECFDVYSGVKNSNRNQLFVEMLKTIHSTPDNWVNFWLACTYHSGDIFLGVKTLYDMQQRNPNLRNSLRESIIEHNALLQQRDKAGLLKNAMYIANKLRQTVKNTPEMLNSEYIELDILAPKTYAGLMKMHASLKNDENINAWLKKLNIPDLNAAFKEMFVVHREYESYVIAKIDDTNKDPNRIHLDGAIENWGSFWTSVLYFKVNKSLNHTPKIYNSFQLREQGKIARIENDIRDHFWRLKKYINTPTSENKSAFIKQAESVGTYLDTIFVK